MDRSVEVGDRARVVGDEVRLDVEELSAEYVDTSGEGRGATSCCEIRHNGRSVGFFE